MQGCSAHPRVLVHNVVGLKCRGERVRPQHVPGVSLGVLVAGGAHHVAREWEEFLAAGQQPGPVPAQLRGRLVH